MSGRQFRSFYRLSITIMHHISVIRLCHILKRYSDEILERGVCREMETPEITEEFVYQTTTFMNGQEQTLWSLHIYSSNAYFRIRKFSIKQHINSICDQCAGESYSSCWMVSIYTLLYSLEFYFGIFRVNWKQNYLQHWFHSKIQIICVIHTKTSWKQFVSAYRIVRVHVQQPN